MDSTARWTLQSILDEAGIVAFILVLVILLLLVLWRYDRRYLVKMHEREREERIEALNMLNTLAARYTSDMNSLTETVRNLATWLRAKME